MAIWIEKLKRKITGFLAAQDSKYITTENGLKIQILDLGVYTATIKNPGSFSDKIKASTSFTVKARTTTIFTERNKSTTPWPNKIKS